MKNGPSTLLSLSYCIDTPDGGRSISCSRDANQGTTVLLYSKLSASSISVGKPRMCGDYVYCQQFFPALTSYICAAHLPASW